jgi:hypothetical protein
MAPFILRAWLQTERDNDLRMGLLLDKILENDRQADPCPLAREACISCIFLFRWSSIIYSFMAHDR